MEINYLYSASVGIKTDDISILCDPWFTQGIFYGSWFHYPYIPEEISRIGKFDYIYISHLHEDHCDIRFLKKYISNYPEVKIIIADRERNFLSKILKASNIDHQCIKSMSYIDTQIDILTDKSRGNSSIDSLLIVKYKDQIYINANDCLIDKVMAKEINSKKQDNIEYKIVLSIGYAGANDWPHMYTSYNEKERLEVINKKIDINLMKFKKGVELISPNIIHPFAGQYILGGSLYKVNEKRGIPDALEAKKLFRNAIVLEEYIGIIDIKKMKCYNERQDEYSKSEMNNYINELKTKEFDYKYNSDNIDINRFKESIDRAYNKYSNNNCLKLEFYTKNIEDDNAKVEKIIEFNFNS